MIKPATRPPTTGRWVSAGLLTMVADITGTLAQFMPMKAVFILAADDIPSFFPSILVAGGPIVTGLALVLAAAVLAGISKFTKDLALSRSAMNEPFPGQRTAHTASPGHNLLFRLTVKEFSSFVLIAVLLAGSSALSLTFSLTIATWIGFSALVLAIKIHRGSRRPPFPNGRVEFDNGFRKWMQDSALWAAVGGAIFTLVIDFPALGLTGILLGAILLRRFQQAVPDIVPLVLSHFNTGATTDSQPLGQVRPTQAPYDFLGTPVGQRLLVKSLQQLQLDDTDWKIVGRPDNIQLTLLTADTGTGESAVCRLFAFGQERFMEHEQSLRTHLDEPKPFHHRAISQESIAGLPGLLIRYHPEKGHQLNAKTDGNEAIHWQIDWEMTCVASESLQKDLNDYVIDDPAQFLFPLLTAASRLRGSHTESISTLLPLLDTIRNRYLDGPRIIHFGGALSHQNFVGHADVWREPINATQWGVGLLGDRWGDSAKYVKFFSEIAKSRNLDRGTAADAILRFHVRRLFRGLQARDLDRIESDSEAIVRLLDGP